MRLTFAILICCLYALSAVDANTFSKSGSTDVQHGNAKPAKPLNLWSDDKSDDGDKDGKWSKDGKDDKDNKDDNDECASRSVAVLIGTSTYAIPCLQGGSIINLNGLIPTPIVTSSIASSSTTEASSSAVSSSALNVVESSSSAASSSAPPSSSAATSSEESSATYSTTTTDTNTTTTDTTTTTTDTTTTTTDTTTTTTTDITGPIAIVTLYDALDCTGNVTFSGSAEVQQGNAKAAEPLNLWSDDKSDDDDKWSKDGKDDKDNKDVNDECASRSVSVLIGTSTYVIPCLQGDSIVNLDALIPTPTSSIASSSATEASSSAVYSSADDSSSSSSSSSAASFSEASSATDSTTTTTDSTTTTTDTTTSADSSPTFTVTVYESAVCTGNMTVSSVGIGCFNVDITPQGYYSAGSSVNTDVGIEFYVSENCIGNFIDGYLILNGCAEYINTGNNQILSYRVFTQ
ncbi:unnamed protein product [Umbelopsis ramanniana]